MPAGTYIFEQAKPEDNPDIIQIFNADGTPARGNAGNNPNRTLGAG
jgi:hypothetical protein